MEFSKKLFTLRKKAGLSQKQLAQKAGVAQSSVNYWEHGERIPGMDQIQKLAKALDVPVLAFISDSEMLKKNDSESYLLPIDTQEELAFYAFEKLIEGICGRCKPITVEVYNKNNELEYDDGYTSVKYNGEKRLIYDKEWLGFFEIVSNLIKEMIPLISKKETKKALEIFKWHADDIVKTEENNSSELYIILSDPLNIPDFSELFSSEKVKKTNFHYNPEFYEDCDLDSKKQNIPKESDIKLNNPDTKKE